MGSFEVDGITYPTSTDYINSKENTWHGVEGTRVIWHGEWSDYEVEYNGELLNGNQLDDYAWDVFKSECDEAGWEADEREMNWSLSGGKEFWMMLCKHKMEIINNI